MKTIIRLLIFALVVNAGVRGGEAAWRYFTFKDAVEQEIRFAKTESTDALKARVLELAAEYDVQLEPVDVDVQKDGTWMTVAAAYVESIELVPRFYTREQLFEFEVSARKVIADDLR